MNRLEAVVFDWAGTTVDHGSLAPVKAVTELFARHGISISDAETRRDMGLFKKDHIRSILAMPRVEAQWRMHRGSEAQECDVEALFAEFAPMQMEVLAAHSDVIAGVSAVTESLRERGLKVGSTTGYTRPMLDYLVARAASQGYRPALALCPDDVGGGRPHPWMCLRIALEFHVTSTAAVVKAGDTISDIQEGRNAGMWTIGVSLTGNEVGMSATELAALPDSQRKALAARVRDSLKSAGAHYVIESVAAVEPVLSQIDARLAAGERP